MIGPQNVSFSTHRPVSGRPVAIMAGLILIGAGLRFYQLTAKGLWADEIFTALFAGPDNDVATVIHNALSTPLPSPPLWFLITHLFVKVLGSNELVLRFPSVLAGTLCIPAIYMVGNELFNRRIALVGATLLAVSPIQIHFSQEARTYAAVVFLSLLGCLFFYRGLTRRQWRWWVGFSLVTLINLYLHLTAILVLASEVVIAFFFLNRPRRTQVLPVLASLMIILIGFSPMAPFLITGIQGPRGLGNITEIEGLSITIEGFLSLFGGLGAGTGVSLSLFLSACLFGLASSFLHHRRQFFLMLGWMGIPFVVIVLLRPKHWFAAKYVISILPIYLIAISLGMVSLAQSFSTAVGKSWESMRVPEQSGIIRRIAGRGSEWFGAIQRIAGRGPEWFGTIWQIAGRIPRPTCLAVLLLFYSLLSVKSLSSVYGWQNDPWKRIGLFLNANVQPKDAVVVVPFNPEILTMTAEEMMAYYGPTSQQVDIVPLTTQENFKAALADHTRLWVVIERNADTGLAWQARSWLDGYPTITLNLGNGTKVLYTEHAVSSMELLVDRVSKLNISNANAYQSLAEVYLDLGRWTEAQEATSQAIALEPDESLWQIYYQASIYQGAGENERALEKYRQALNYSTRREGYTVLGNFYRRIGLLNEAIEAYRRAILPYQKLPVGTELDETLVLRDTIDELERLLDTN